MPASFVAIDSQSSTPPFEQLRSQVIAAVRSGELAHDTRLPTVRALAAELGLATNTVARAYRELERDAVIETRGRFGSFIAPNGDAAARQAQAAAASFAARIQQLGVSREEALALVTEALERPSA
ncbi:GntR family transcriptional regulator [Cryobacterium sp. TMS1-20-1]|uniref:DNA-binding transcriptional regulator YhcF, GntR family n=1 Tax=Cryobacterium levicorallinum TaxID=995038 RepID=A0A1I3DVM5_9MICO|nr:MULTISPECIES: GntR family transcriptional regulator [Cryobacterium]TFB83954.1 GntR family transcriptional regulator [Cryobacterium levicorallinum]TFC77604.1 GntR family transcriptional regulator [Cryobacterium sp. TMS1-20-1]TFD56302.1 GntR family transcriptional regulator [Cryobacterium sp. Hh7]TFD63308.1 GntR family transcriptional regulator [Cryobacterium sp. Hh38]SFH90782.1 DNA-binding transcriptional regulator YhcF, GntR family [Cryobacterium levicorallinum]